MAHMHDKKANAESRDAVDCPHIDRNDARCGHRFSLGRIEQAFGVCFGAFHGCPIYHRINHEIHDQHERITYTCAGAAATSQAEPSRITIHIAGQPLRATGT